MLVKDFSQIIFSQNRVYLSIVKTGTHPIKHEDEILFPFLGRLVFPPCFVGSNKHRTGVTFSYTNTSQSTTLWNTDIQIHCVILHSAHCGAHFLNSKQKTLTWEFDKNDLLYKYYCCEWKKDINKTFQQVHMCYCKERKNEFSDTHTHTQCMYWSLKN